MAAVVFMSAGHISLAPNITKKRDMNDGVALNLLTRQTHAKSNTVEKNVSMGAHDNPPYTPPGDCVPIPYRDTSQTWIRNQPKELRQSFGYGIDTPLIQAAFRSQYM